MTMTDTKPPKGKSAAGATQKPSVFVDGGRIPPATLDEVLARLAPLLGY